MRGLMMVAAVSLAALSVSGCAYMDSDEEQAAEREEGAVAGTPAGGSGDATTRSYAVSGFTGVTVTGSDNVEIAKGDAFAVTATGDPAVLDRLIIRVRDGALEVRRRSGVSISNRGSATVKVTMPVLTSIEAAGSGRITSDTLTGDDASVEIAGSGDVRLTGVAARKLGVAIAGSGAVEVAGTAEEVDAGIAGSGSLNGPTLSARTADISMAGSGSVTMAVSGPAEISMMGSGNVTLTGGATCTTSKMGSGEVNCS